MTETEPWRNWAGTVTAHPVRVVRPRTVDELVAEVRRAAADGLRVRAVGAGHSFTDAAVTDGVMVDMTALDRAVIDTATRQVTVEGGSTLRRLNRRLAAHGLAMANLGDIDLQTVSGALATGTHGTGLALGGTRDPGDGSRARARGRISWCAAPPTSAPSCSPPPWSGWAPTASSPRSRCSACRRSSARAGDAAAAAGGARRLRRARRDARPRRGVLVPAHRPGAAQAQRPGARRHPAPAPFLVPLVRRRRSAGQRCLRGGAADGRAPARAMGAAAAAARREHVVHQRARRRLVRDLLLAPTGALRRDGVRRPAGGARATWCAT